jgi:fucose permease
MLICSVIMGYGAGAIDTGLNNFVSLHYKAQHMNWLHCFWGIGVTVSPMIMSQFLTGETGAWRNGYRVVAALQVVFALLVLFTLPKWKKSEAPVSAESEEKGDKTLIDILKTKGILTSILSLGLYCSMEFLLGTWGATFIVNTLGLSPDTAAMWVSLYYGGIMLGRVIAGFVSMKYSDNSLIRAGIIVCFAGMIVLLLPLGAYSLAGLLLIGIGFGPVFPSTLHAVPERFGKKYSADITGYHMGGAYAIGFGIQLIYGFVASATTFRITPFVLMGLCLSLAFFSEKTIRTVKNK